jgi:hypothetical protein
MGIVQSQVCVDLSILPAEVWEELQAEEFTVQRTPKNPGDPSLGESGVPEEAGWRIQQKPHSSMCSGHNAGKGPTDQWYGDALATKCMKGQGDVWRIFMNNGWSETRAHACGWRPCDPSRRSFWPTRCKTPLEKEAWWAWFDEQLESLPRLSSHMNHS